MGYLMGSNPQQNPPGWFDCCRCAAGRAAPFGQFNRNLQVIQHLETYRHKCYVVYKS